MSARVNLLICPADMHSFDLNCLWVRRDHGFSSDGYPVLIPKNIIYPDAEAERWWNYDAGVLLSIWEIVCVCVCVEAWDMDTNLPQLQFSVKALCWEISFTFWMLHETPVISEKWSYFRNICSFVLIYFGTNSHTFYIHAFVQLNCDKSLWAPYTSLSYVVWDQC